jgi:hypothetical protein
MKNKLRPSRLLIPLAFALFFYLINRYQDTVAFQSVMAFLFNPEKGLALPLFWQNNRMIFLGGMAALAAASYQPTWKLYINLIDIYRKSPEKNSKPRIVPLQAAYLYQQNKVASMTAWLIGQCCLGTLALRYRKGTAPWSFRKAKPCKTGSEDKELLSMLFQADDILNLKPSFSDPHPDVLQTAEKLTNILKGTYGPLFHKRQSGLLVWMLLTVCIVELPFFMASLDHNMSAILPITIFFTIICVAPAYVFAYLLTDFFNGPRGMAMGLLLLSIVFVLFGQFLLFSSSSTAPYWESSLYPNIAAIMITLLYLAPLLPKDTSLLSHIVSYRKHLGRAGYEIQEEDLPWTVGLGAHSGLLEGSFHYGGKKIPEWLQRSSEDDVQVLMKKLHQSFMTDVNSAIYGKMKRSRKRRMSRRT